MRFSPPHHMQITLSSSVTGMLLLLFLITGCNNTKAPPDSDIARSPEELDKKASDHIRQSIEYAAAHQGDIGDSISLFNTGLLQTAYERNSYEAFWSSREQWKPLGDSLLSFIEKIKLYGLFPEDYHSPALDSIRTRFLIDSLSRSYRKDAVLWSKADLMLTDAFFRILKDIKLGRLPQDSLTLRKDSVLNEDFYLQQLNIFQKSGGIAKLVRYLEPKHKGYHLLKDGIQKFLDSADNRTYTKVPAPGKDPVNFKRTLQKRLFESGFIAYDSIQADSVELAAAVKKFQQRKGIKVDGKAGDGTLRMLNTTDRERFINIAI